MYASIGYGGLNTTQILNKLKKLYDEAHEEEIQMWSSEMKMLLLYIFNMEINSNNLLKINMMNIKLKFVQKIM